MTNKTILRWFHEAIKAYEDNLGMYTGTPYESGYRGKITRLKRAYDVCQLRLTELEELHETDSIR